MMWSYVLQLVFIVFIPIMGRKGSINNPEFLIGIITCVTVFVLLQPFLPILISYSRKLISISVAVWALAFVVTLLVVLFSEVGFPYSGDRENPIPKRMILYHTRKNEFGTVSGGFLFARSDYYDPTELDDIIPEYRNAVHIPREVCDVVLGCSLPIYQKWSTSNLKSQKTSKWLEASPPAIQSDPVSISIISDEPTMERRRNITLEVEGPKSIVLILVPNLDVGFTSWSIDRKMTTASQWQGRDAYFFNLIQGLNSRKVDFWIEMEVSTDWTREDGYMTALLNGHHHEGENKFNLDLKGIVEKFPSWVTLSAWTVDTLLLAL